MRPAWWRYALPQRLGTLAAAALILWTVVTAGAAAIVTDRIADEIATERLARAQAIAARVNGRLEEELRQLDLVAAAAARDPLTIDGQVRQVRLADSVLRVAADGQVLWARDVGDGREIRPAIDRIPPPPGGLTRVEGTRLLGTRSGPRAFLLLPARESDPVGGAVAAAIDPRTSGFRAMLAAYAGEPYRVELLDSHGGEIAASRAAAPATGESVIEAAVPLSPAQWKVRLVQPRRVALGQVFVLRRVLVGSSLLLLPFAVLVAVAAAGSIRQPVLTMTATAERLARGEYAAPIAIEGEDEIARLAVALDRLRMALQGEERRALLLKRVLSAQEEERRRIARELHDETTQQLSALAMQLDSLAASRPGDAPALGRAQAIAHAAIENLHRVIHDLRPSMLDDLGLLPAIRSYAETHLGANGIIVHCEFPPALPVLAREATTALYRVAQEALTNVARHSKAETVLIGCTVSESQVVLEIEDDGVGFDPLTETRPRETGEGLGLLGMHERLALVGGHLEVESEPGHGTRIVAVLPLASRGDA